MTNFCDLYPGEKLVVHIDHAATVTARMPTPDECAIGYPPDGPVIVVANGGLNEKVFQARLVMLTFDDPHGQPGPDMTREAMAYMLSIIGTDLSLAAARIDELANAARRSPCNIAHLLDEVRAEQDANWPN